jgi:tetratricopeptide (TPR) repeat protein
MYYNNLAAIHFQMGKYSLASMYYSKAVQANESEAGRAPLADQSRAPLKTQVADRLFELLYNQGLNFLFMGETERALKCFKATLLVFGHNPRTW